MEKSDEFFAMGQKHIRDLTRRTYFSTYDECFLSEIQAFERLADRMSGFPGFPVEETNDDNW
jgi:hypothetical protein